MNQSKVWSLTALSAEDRQYAGNVGYEDAVERLYLYDSHVANHKQLNIGDLALIRNRFQLIGVARIEKIDIGSNQKSLLRCPICSTTGLRKRKKIKPDFRCREGHEFNSPREESITVETYAAHYGKTFIAIENGISSKAIKKLALRPNDQLAIEELDPSRIEKVLSEKYPQIIPLFKNFAQYQTIDPDDAMVETNEKKKQYEPFVSSLMDSRKAVLRSIKTRRGQKKFRDGLKREYGAACMVSNCTLWGAIEASHIDPYRDVNDNHPQNGLLLRTDLHTLFDLNLMAINPETLTVHFHALAISNGYGDLEGVKLKINKNCKPALEPLKNRWLIFNKNS